MNGNNGVMMGGTGQPPTVIEPEPDLNDDDLLLLSGEGITQEPTTIQGFEDEEGDIEEDDASPSEIEQLRAELARTQGALSTLLKRAQSSDGSPAPNNDPLEAAHSAFFADHPDVPEETQKFFKDYGKTLVTAMAGAIAPRIQGLENTLRDSSGKEVLKEFETQLDAVMDRSNLPRSLRDVFKESVMLDGLKRYGNQFSTEQAIKLYRSKLKTYLDEQGEQSRFEEDELENANNNEPPPTRRGGNLSARSDVTGKLMKSTQRDNSFGGKNWRRHISARIRELTNGGA